MKILSTNLLTTLNTQEVKDLTTTVKEILALNISSHKKIFTAADLWNIQKNKRSFSRSSLRSAY